MKRSIRILMVLSVVGVLAMSTSLVYAHVVYEEDMVYWSSTICTEARSEISHGKGYGYTKAVSRAKREMRIPGGSVSCVERWIRPANKIKARYVLMHHNGSDDGQWSTCLNGSYQYNSRKTDAFSVYRSLSRSEYCGDGWYATKGYAYVENGGSWFGGSVWSGSHDSDDF